jgi:hypothetical protein
VRLDVAISEPAAGPLAADDASERVTGSPSPGSANRTDRGLPGYRAILFERAVANHPAGLPLARRIASGNAAFQAKHPLSTGTLSNFGTDTDGPLTRLTTLQPPPHEDCCKPGYQPTG